MNSAGWLRFVASGGSVAAAAGALAMAWGASLGARATAWAALGWAATAIPGLAAGAWLVREHGRTGSGFVAAMGTGMIVRLVATLGCMAAALRAGGEAYRPCLVGLAAGYVPLQVLEALWVLGRSRAGSARAEVRTGPVRFGPRAR